MTPWTAFEYPKNLAGYDRPGTRKDIAVVGGGVAGLTAAYELSKLKHKVTVFEASDRWGGRIYTERFGDLTGPYAELGAMRIPYGHCCVDHYVTQLGLRPRAFVSQNNQAWFHFRGQRVSRRDWDQAAAIFGSTQNSGLIENDLAGALGPLDKVLWGQVMGTWQEPLDLNESRSFGQLVASAISSRVLSPADWDWLSNVKGFRWLEDASALFWANVGMLLDTVGRYEIVGGMSKLVDAFETELVALGATMRKNAAVSAISVDEQSVTVRSDDAAQRFDFSIVAIPAPCAARMEFTPRLPAAQIDALRSVHYFPVAKSVVLYRERFWEDPSADGIVGGSSVTDMPNQQVWYPSDNARPATARGVEHLESRLGVIRGDRLTKMPADPADWTAKSAEDSKGPGALIGGYMWGTNAERFGSLDPASRDQVIRDCLEQIHPGSSRHELKIVHRVWAQHENPGGGGFAYLRPNDQRRYGRLISQPHPNGSRPRLFFAGEHDGIAQGWIQGAIQSALAAAASVLSS